MSRSVWIIVPCFNEARRLDRSAFLEAAASASDTHYLFVDDGSTDETGAVIREMASEAAQSIGTLALPSNSGKAEAVRQGMLRAIEADAHCVGYWDADLATPLDVIPDFASILAEDDEVDVVMGARARMLGRQIQRSGLRHLAGRAYATAAAVALRLPVYDTQCGAKLFRNGPALKESLKSPFSSRWAFDVELLRRLQIQWGDSGIGRIVEVPLLRWRDVGESKVSLLSGGLAFGYVLRLMLLSRLSSASRVRRLRPEEPRSDQELLLEVTKSDSEL